jgi:transposase-like protein
MFDVKENGIGSRGAQRAEGARSGVAPNSGDRSPVPHPELTERPRRRRFTAEFKLRLLQQADACTQPGELGSLLRREGLYTSHLAAWRRQRDQGGLAALGRSRGRPKRDPLAVENAKLRHRAERAEAELAKAQKVIEVQGKLSALLEQWLETTSAPPSAPATGRKAPAR